MGRRLAGAVYTPSEEAGDCRQFTEALFRRLKELGNAEFRMASPVRGLRREGRKIVAVETATGHIGAGAVVLAAGMGSRALLKPVGRSEEHRVGDACVSTGRSRGSPDP